MAKGTEIVLTVDSRGREEEIYVSGTPKPGTVMEMTSTAPKGGRFTYRARTGVDGAKGGCPVLLPDRLQGKLETDAYVSGTRGFIYWPQPGEELNMLLRYQPGTGTSTTEQIGDKLEVDGASGMLQGAGASGASAPFQLMEHLGVALTADKLVHCKFLGNNA